MPETFFKYHTAETAKIVLFNHSRRWSSPTLFNDPFDNDFSLHLTSDHTALAQRHVDEVLGLMAASTPIENPTQSTLLSQLEWARHNRIGEFTENIRSGMIRVVQDEMAKGSVKFNTELDKIREQLGDTLVYCVSETRDNILMWSHYASNHTGVVIELAPVENSPLTIAKPVQYSKNLPVIERIAVANSNLTETFLEKLWYTKSEQWAYEKEWRIPTTARNLANKKEDLAFNPNELIAVYLGCRMSTEDRSHVVDITRLKYPSVKIYQAKKSRTQFALDFFDIDSVTT